MAISIGNKTQSNQNPNGSSQTLAHTQNNGSDLGLLVVITMFNNVDFSGCTYGGDTMTLVQNIDYSGQSQRTAAYYLQSPSTGNNNIVVSFSGSQVTSTSIFAVSFTGAGNFGSFDYDDELATPNSQSITISDNSIIYLTGLSLFSQNTLYSIGGSSRPFEFSHSTARVVRGALSTTGLSAGATNVTTTTDVGSVTNFRVEIQEASSPPSGINEGSFWLLMD